jgi:hypothetical protein
MDQYKLNIELNFKHGKENFNRQVMTDKGEKKHTLITGKINYF